MRKWQIRHAAIWCNWGWGVVVVCGGVQALYPHLRWISDRWFTKSKSVSPLTATTSSRSPRRLKLWLERTPRPQPDTLATTRAVAECVPRLVQCNLPENAGKRRNGKLAGPPVWLTARTPLQVDVGGGQSNGSGSGYRNCFTVCGSSIRSQGVHTDRCLLLLS